MEEVTCPNCNCDVDKTELKQNHLLCPTCGFDMSDIEEPDEDKDDEKEDKDEDSDEDDGEA